MLYSGVLVSDLFLAMARGLVSQLYIDVDSKLLGYQVQQRPTPPHTCPGVTADPPCRAKDWHLLITLILASSLFMVLEDFFTILEGQLGI